MKPPIFPVVAFEFILAASAFASGPLPTEPKHLEPSAPRTVTLSAAEPPPVIRTALLQSTLILLPDEEKVVNVFAGDTVDWVFDGGRLASRFISVKPKVAGVVTDVHIVSDHGNEYTLALREVSSDDDPHFDSRILIASGDQAAKDRLIELPVFVPASELDKVKQEAASAQAAQAAAQKAQAAQEEANRSQYPGTLRFDYLWDRTKARALGLEQIWRDDKFTYLRGKFEETPALYEVKDKKPSLINFDFKDGLYTVPKKLDRGYLEIGKQKVDFHSSEEGR